MAKNYSKHVGVNVTTPQTQQAKPNQVQNLAGGYTFQVDAFKLLRRWLILGTTASQYYATEKQLTLAHAKNIEQLFADESTGLAAVDEIVRVSVDGLSSKNDPAIFALAVAVSSKNAAVRKYALQNLSKICRIGTHLFTFAQYFSGSELRGWGRGIKHAVARWYTERDLGNLAYQVCKYQSRAVEGCLPWSHRDLLRLSHAKPTSKEMSLVFKYVVKGLDGLCPREQEKLETVEDLNYIFGHELAKKATSVKEVLPLIREYKLSRESIPTELLQTKEVYEQLLPHMPLGAMIRNLGNMSKCGFLTPLSKAVKMVCEKLGDEEALKEARIHPLGLLSARLVYASGQSYRGSGEWTPVQPVVDALEDAFYKSFQYVQPTGKRILLAVDVSGSMSSVEVAGLPGVEPSQAAAVMAMVMARTEAQYQIIGFSNVLLDPGITAKDSFESALRKIANINGGGTNCALPLKWAIDHKTDVDAFVILTDNETWSGSDGHPFELLNRYRRKFVANAKVICVTMVPYGDSIVEQDDPGSLDVVGFDASAPQIISSFILGEV